MLMRSWTRYALLLALAVVAIPSVARAQTPPETIEYYATDTIGSIRIAFDVNGTVLGRRDFTPFGTPVVPAPTMPKEGFGGNVKDDETDLSYFHARMFQARTGRFTRPDPIFAGMYQPQRWNRYSYALQNPAEFTDPTGLNAAPNDCTWIDDPDSEFGGYFANCGFTVSSSTGGGGGGFWSSLWGALFGGPGDPTDALAWGAAEWTSNPGASAQSSGRDPTIGPVVATRPPGSVMPADTPPQTTIAPDGPRIGPVDSTGDHQINAIASGVNNSAAALFTRPSTYGAFYGLSAAGGAAGALCVGMCGPAAVNAEAAYLRAAEFIQNAAIRIEIAQPGMIDFFSDVVQTQIKGPSSTVMTPGNVAGFTYNFLTYLNGLFGGGG